MQTAADYGKGYLVNAVLTMLKLENMLISILSKMKLYNLLQLVRELEIYI